MQQVLTLSADKQALQSLAQQACSAVERYSVDRSGKSLIEGYQQALKESSTQAVREVEETEIEMNPVVTDVDETLTLNDKHLWR